MSKYITSDPNILGGTPVIADTRIPIKRIIYLFGDGYTVEAIHEEYPHVSIEKINGVINEIAQAFGARHEM